MAGRREDVGFKTKLMIAGGRQADQGQHWGGHTDIQRAGRGPLSGLISPTVTSSPLPGTRVESDHFVDKTGGSQRLGVGAVRALRPQTLLTRPAELTKPARPRD